jgi:hypothetical protein
VADFSSPQATSPKERPVTNPRHVLVQARPVVQDGASRIDIEVLLPPERRIVRPVDW